MELKIYLKNNEELFDIFEKNFSFCYDMEKVMNMNNPYIDILDLKKANPTPAAKELRKQFLKLCYQKSMQTITITELCNKAHVARTTFYANYMNTDVLLNEIEDDLIVDLLKVNQPHSHSQTETSLYAHNVYQFVEKHQEELNALLVIQNDTRFIEKWKKAVKYHFYEAFQANASSEFVLEIIASISLSSYTYLLKHPQKFNIDEMIQMINTAIQMIHY